MSTADQNMFSESQFISTYLTHPLRHSISQISDIVGKAPNLCSLKDAKTRKYLLTNNFQVEVSGLHPNEILDLTTDDLGYGFYNGSKEAFAKKIKEFDDQINVDHSIIFHREKFLTYQGFVQWRNIIKVPVMSKEENKVIAILSYDEDLTDREDPFELFKLYQKHYLSKQAIEKFLGYFEVDTCFQEMPGEAETHIIIAMLYDSHHKAVAELLNRSYRTIAHHTWALSNKLKEGTTLARVLKKMRSKWIRTRAN